MIPVQIIPDGHNPTVVLTTTPEDLANVLCRTSLLADWHERAEVIIDLLGGAKR